MRRHRSSLLRNLSPHGICALGVFLFSQVVPLVSQSEFQPLMDRIHQFIAPMDAVEKVGIVLIEKAGADENGASGSAPDQSGRGRAKVRSTVTATDG